jgi:type II secretory pathway component PulK
MLISLHAPRQTERRQGLVLLAVLVVLVLLSLAAYRYSESMVSEYAAAAYDHKLAQARAYADSGIHYAMAVLANPDNITNLLNSNPYDDMTVFRNHSVDQGYFTLIAPLNPTNTGANGTCQYGVIDEGSKININAVMAADSSGNTLYQMLLLLPNMTDEIANSIVDWVDTDSTPRQGGAENDYYNGLSPPYNCKNGPLESIEELLLVKGVTPQLLFGSDLNRNGYYDPNEDNNTTPSGAFDRGWSAYLTIYSREQNFDANGLVLTNLNDSSVDLLTMYDTLSTNLGDDLAKFIIMYRQFGSTSSTSSSSSNSSNASNSANSSNGSAMSSGQGTTKSTSTTNNNASTSNNASKTQVGVLASYTLDTTKQAKQQIKSLYDLINATVQISTASKTPNQPPTVTVYKSPLSDPTQQTDLLPKLFETATVFAGTEIPARINMNTAPPEVLTALPGLSTADVQAITTAQPQYASADPPGDIYQTPAWLITQANISPSKLSSLEPMITTRTQVYRVQSLGYADASKGRVARIEAVIDINPMNINGVYTCQPRILTWRDMSDFGRVQPPQ